MGYRVRPTARSECKYSAIRVALDKAFTMSCRQDDCAFAKEVRDVQRQVDAGNRCIIVAGITLDVAEQLQTLRQTKLVSISDIVEHGITYFKESAIST